MVQAIERLFSLFDQYPVLPAGVGVALVVAAVVRRWSTRKRQADQGNKLAASGLDQALFKWSDRDPFRVRDLLNGGALIVGRAGSGKTSSSGRTLMQAIVNFHEEGAK